MNLSRVAAILCVGLSLNGLAQTASDAPASKEDVERYFRAVHSHDMMQKMLDAMSKPIHQMAHEQCAKDKDKLPADCEARLNKFMDNMTKQIPYDEMMQATVPAYQKHFTKGDMDALVAFYSAPTGQKVLQELPSVTAESMESMMPIMRKSIDRMTQSIEEEVAQMRKDASNKAPDAAAAQN